MEAFGSAESFARTLLHGVLFLGDQVIPDIFLYISTPFCGAITANGALKRFIEESLRSGAIIPAFRSDTGGSFIDNFAEIRSQNILGLQPNAESVALWLQEAVKGVRLHYKIWPTAPVSVGFRKLLENTIFGTATSAESGIISTFLHDSEPIREAILSTASADSLGGWRRGDLQNIVGRYTGAIGPGGEINDISKVWQASNDAKTSETSRRLLKWINYCYHFNQGRMLELSPGLTALDDADMEFAVLLAQGNSEAHTESGHHIASSFALPSTDALLSIDPAELLSIRSSNIGQSYFESLKNWKINPSESSAAELLSSLENYATHLTSAYLRKGKSYVNWEWFIHAAIPTGASIKRANLRDLALELGKEAISELASVSGLGLLSLFGKTAAATFECLPGRAREIVAPVFGANQRIEFEIKDGLHKLKQAKVAVGKVEASFD